MEYANENEQLKVRAPWLGPAGGVGGLSAWVGGRHTDNSRSSRYRDIGNLAVAIAILGNDRDKWNPKKTSSKIVFCHF